MTIVLLVRHGRTRANASGVLAGRTPGVDLDGRGRRQAASVGARLAHLPLSVVVHSPLRRCRQTAAAIVDRQRADLPVASDERFVECDYGAWTGGALADLARDPLWEQVQAEPSRVTFPGGESLAGVAARAVTAVADWVQRHPEGVVAVVSHGDVIKAVLSDALGQPLDQFQRIAVGPGSLSVVQYAARRPLVLRLNDTTGRLRLPGPAPRPTVGGGA